METDDADVERRSDVGVSDDDAAAIAVDPDPLVADVVNLVGHETNFSSNTECRDELTPSNFRLIKMRIKLSTSVGRIKITMLSITMSYRAKKMTVGISHWHLHNPIRYHVKNNHAIIL